MTSLSVPVRDPVPRNREEPRRQVFDRLNNTVACRELIKNVLEDILRVARIADAAPYEVEKGPAVPLHGCVDPGSILHRSGIYVQRLSPLLIV